MSSSPEKLLIVGSNPRNQELLVEFVAKLGYTTLRADTLEMLDTLLDDAPQAAFALVDITGFGNAIWSRCARLHEMDIPLLLIAPRQSLALKQLGFAHGAQTILQKPVGMKDLADTIRGLLHPKV